ncbi:hypothetical protein H8356DRAFT_1638291 [Neocallimastix lanati (nom. inval.)]|nr:hypothetical protein H8356DRAFT_1638291 [Neocallimastix sp. JGI-2020a]
MYGKRKTREIYFIFITTIITIIKINGRDNRASSLFLKHIILSLGSIPYPFSFHMDLSLNKANII